MSDDARSRFDPRFDPAFQPGYDGPLVSRTPAPEPVTVPPVWSVEPPQQSAVPDPEVDDPAPRRANPFLIALGAVAIVLVGAGLAVVSQVRTLFAGPDAITGIDYPTTLVLIISGPLLMFLGVATGIGVLFVLAARRDRD